MYVLVRADLPFGQQMAQASHAAAEFAVRFADKVVKTPTLVVLSVADEDHLMSHAEDVGGHLFFEPDLGDTGEYTALAVVCDGRHFSSLPLAGGGD